MSHLRITLLGVITLFLLTLSACGNDNNEISSDDVKSLVDEYSANFSTSEMAYITSNELVIASEAGEETAYELPEDEFFVSIAPYFEQTHP